MNYPNQVILTEVGPRDGLQNEPFQVPTATKVDFINILSETGLQHIEQHKIRIRVYISCALGCPYEGTIEPSQVETVIQQLLPFNPDEFSLGDTIGVGTPKQTKALIDMAVKHLPLSHLNMHFHDTYGQAIANIHTALQQGVYRFDSAVAGLGGCPYARGASGNVATEDVLYLMHGLGIDTGIDIFKVVQAGDMICRAIGRKNQSKVANALMAVST